MGNRKIFRYVLIVVLLLAASLSCKTVMSPDEVVEQVVSTQIEGMVTDIDIEGMVTDMDFESIVTDMGAMVTDMDLGFLDETPAPGSSGERPQDIPIMPGNASMLFESSDLVEYSILAELQKVVDFYESEMPKNGWSKVAGESESSTDFTLLVFEKQGRKALIEIAPDFFSSNTTVTISISS